VLPPDAAPATQLLVLGDIADITDATHNLHLEQAASRLPDELFSTPSAPRARGGGMPDTRKALVTITFKAERERVANLLAELRNAVRQMALDAEQDMNQASLA